ncbi:MAG: hypothetical protein ACTHJ8_08885 [Mucilaginibacter sp.]
MEMAENGKSSYADVKNADYEVNTLQEKEKNGIDLLNLLAEIIIEIIVREANERNRVHKKK